MDYKEEQVGEIEALESIYYGDVASKIYDLLQIESVKTNEMN